MVESCISLSSYLPEHTRGVSSWEGPASPGHCPSPCPKERDVQQKMKNTTEERRFVFQYFPWHLFPAFLFCSAPRRLCSQPCLEHLKAKDHPLPQTVNSVRGLSGRLTVYSQSWKGPNRRFLVLLETKFRNTLMNTYTGASWLLLRRRSLHEAMVDNAAKI